LPKVALITAIDSEDGNVLADFLLSEGYAVHGIKLSAWGGDQQAELAVRQGVKLHTGDLRDVDSLMRVVQDIKPDEIYNLTGLVRASVPPISALEAADVDALGTLRLLQCIRVLGLEQKTRFFNASTSAMKALLPQPVAMQVSLAGPQDIAHVYAHLMTAHHREVYGMFACNGVWFNPESPCTGERLVHQQIDQGLANVAQGHEDCILVDNLDSLRDWTEPRLAARMQWLALQQLKANDSLLTNGAAKTVRQFIALTAKKQGFELAFKGTGQNEYAVVVAASKDRTPALNVGQVILGVLPSEP
jgi:GDPmannose 4,6-dehydratase